MKCQRENCTGDATFHITELTSGSPQELHLCEQCARDYLAQSDQESPAAAPNSLAEGLLNTLPIGKTTEELQQLDKRTCPMCGITFAQFRSQGRLGCPNDYSFFEKELEPLLLNIHGETSHVGRRPSRGAGSADRQTELIRLRKELKAAIGEEDYERASKIRDEIRRIERESAS